MLNSLSKIGEDFMVKVNDSLIKLFELTNGFNSPSLEHFENPIFSIMLMAGRGLDQHSTPKKNYTAYMASSGVFKHHFATTEVTKDYLMSCASRILDYTFSETENLKKINADWVTKNPFCLPVLINAVTDISKREFAKKHKTTKANDIKIGATDANRFIKSLEGKEIRSKSDILASIAKTVEGIVRNLVGKIVNESFVDVALSKLDIPYVRDNGTKAPIKGYWKSSQADFAIPNNESPKAYIEVRGCTASHASVYAGNLSFTCLNRRIKHPGCLSILIYDNEWTSATLRELAEQFDYVINVQESYRAAEIIKRHLSGENMTKPRSIPIALLELISEEELKSGFVNCSSLLNSKANN